MNTQAIFLPAFWKERVLDETQQHGWTRIEISYYASDALAENELLDPLFKQQAEQDLDDVLQVLNATTGVHFDLSMERTLQVWEQRCKTNQLFLLQPDVCALIFDKNAKNGSYCGIFHEI